MRFEWDEAKRKSNLKLHGLDFADAHLYSAALRPCTRTTDSVMESSASSLSAYCAVLQSRSCTRNRRMSFASFPFGEQHTMKQRSSSKHSRSTSRRRRTRQEVVKVTAEHPELDPKHVVRVIVRNGLKPVLPKATISLRVDADVLEWFKSGGPGYQTRINAVLRAFKEASV